MGSTIINVECAIAPNKGVSRKLIFLISPLKHVVGTHQKCLSTHNICFHGEIRKTSVLFWFYFWLKKSTRLGCYFLGSGTVLFTLSEHLVYTDKILLWPLTLLLLNTTCSVLAPEEANWSGSALFIIHYVNFYKKPRSSNLIGWNLKWA